MHHAYFLKVLKKRAYELEFAHCFLINFTYAKYKVALCIKNLLIPPILYERSAFLKNFSKIRTFSRIPGKFKNQITQIYLQL